MFEVVNGEGASSYVRSAFASAPYTVAGKTGTAEVAGQKDNAFFVGYAPYTDPKVVVTAFVEEGRTGGLASGIVRDVMDAYSANVSPLTDPVG
jgi:cell division protein FtsI/penicillin-binding protein 2